MFDGMGKPREERKKKGWTEADPPMQPTQTVRQKTENSIHESL